MYTQVGCVLIETVCIEHSALWPVSDQIITSLLANFTYVSKLSTERHTILEVADWSVINMSHDVTHIGMSLGVSWETE
jgi:hypothetical protein